MTTPPPLRIEHRVRVSALEPERIWKLLGDTLWMCTEGQADIPIPLASIRRIRLSFDPSRSRTNLFRCHIHNHTGKIAVIQNIHFKGFASFEDMSPAYCSFVETLVPRVASLSPGCVFATGTSWLGWTANAVFLFITFSFLVLAMIWFYTAIGALVIIKLILIAFFIPLVIRWFLRNKPGTFPPNAIPQGILPRH